MPDTSQDTTTNQDPYYSEQYANNIGYSEIGGGEIGEEQVRTILTSNTFIIYIIFLIIIIYH